VTQVIVTGDFPIADGINFLSNGDLVVVSNAKNVYLLRTTDNWVTGKVVDTYAVTSATGQYSPTAAGLVNNVPYVSSAIFAAPPNTYPLERVTFAGAATSAAIPAATTTPKKAEGSLSVLPSILFLVFSVLLLLS